MFTTPLVFFNNFTCSLSLSDVFVHMSYKFLYIIMSMFNQYFKVYISTDVHVVLCHDWRMLLCYLNCCCFYTYFTSKTVEQIFKGTGLG